MRRVALIAVLGVAAVLAGGCGDEAAAPAAATDTTEQVATVAAAPAAASRGASGRVNEDPASSAPAGVLRGTFRRLNGERVDLASYRGRVVLVVNTATECGYTPQFEGLEALYRARRGDGLVVLGFPADDVAGQEPRSDAEIATFCEANYGVSFPMFAKSKVVGAAANPLFRRLTAAAGAPEWNFNKYLLDRRGRVIARYGAGTEPRHSELERRIDALFS